MLVTMMGGRLDGLDYDLADGTNVFRRPQDVFSGPNFLKSELETLVYVRRSETSVFFDFLGSVKGKNNE